MAMMNDIQFSIVIRLGSSMLRRSTDMCVICGSRGVNILCHDTSLCQHEETICMNLEFEKSAVFFSLKVLYFFQLIAIIYVLFYITL